MSCKAWNEPYFGRRTSSESWDLIQTINQTFLTTLFQICIAILTVHSLPARVQTKLLCTETPPAVTEYDVFGAKKPRSGVQSELKWLLCREKYLTDCHAGFDSIQIFSFSCRTSTGPGTRTFIRTSINLSVH